MCCSGWESIVVRTNRYLNDQKMCKCKNNDNKSKFVFVFVDSFIFFFFLFLNNIYYRFVVLFLVFSVWVLFFINHVVPRLDPLTKI